MGSKGTTQYFKAAISDVDVDIMDDGATFIGTIADTGGDSLVGELLNDASTVYFSSKDPDGITMKAEPVMEQVDGTNVMNDGTPGDAVNFSIVAIGCDTIATRDKALEMKALKGKSKFVYFWDDQTGHCTKTSKLKIKVNTKATGNNKTEWTLSGEDEDDEAFLVNTIGISAPE